MEGLSSLRECLYQLEERLLKPGVRTSQKELKKILAADFFEFGSSGKVLYKNEDIDKNGIGVVKMTLSDFEVHPLSKDVALTTYRIFNEINNQHSLRSSIWKFREGRWQMYFHQVTPAKF
ncbi:MULTISPECIES: DUF4440 domain-containing protein [Bacillus cereus group]|uniref:nuclear transport factor 2 family protein n=1 Tax=Bacillus cereus group TaxID=86661 RepID=UPI0024BC7917|nr:DUF4440 domain-containing protein [Bacillus cereus]